ncbi:murein biosynthesis integral membrane protein MurJ [Bacillus alkalisoli]|uniref:murein biosynthesis integral membrane protein MurJ n=1 Tax=Bacillus alkalisoli TaxID=2011008 RepID=UPI000C235175|nr:murein biosynthesis integral membrane protein MurJ [Bacillus alkalisoli]
MSKLKVASILLLFSTFFLKFSSMLRDVTIGYYFGSSSITDAYFAAMTIPTAIILFMLTGMKGAFLPSYYKYEKDNKGFSHLTNIVKGTFGIGVIISLAGIIASPYIIRFFYPSFTDQAAEVAVWTLIFYFAAVVLVGVNAVYEGYFDAKKKFSFSTFSQTIVVICTIGSMIILHSHIGIYSVPIGYFVGTIISLIMKLLYLKPANFLNWKQKINRKEVQMFYIVFLPVGLTIAVGQINMFVNTLFAAGLGEGVVTNLNYAFRLVNIPQAIFGVVIATIIFPILAEAKSQNNDLLFKNGIEKGLSFMFLFLAPAVAGMVLLMKPLVQLVYERGAFDSIATSLTSEYAIFYIGSVLFYSIQAVIAKGFYTLEKGHYILRVGIFSIILNVIFNAILSKLMGPVGLALSTSLVGFIYSAITFTTLYKLVGGFNLRRIGLEYTKIAISTICMIGLLLLVVQYLEGFGNVFYIITAIIIGVPVYFIALFLLKVESLREILRSSKLKKLAK